MSLPDPNTSSPSRPPVASFTAIRLMEGEMHSRTFTKAYSQLYAAKVWLRTMMGDEAGVRVGNEIRLDGGIKIRCFEFDKVMSYELSKEESQWRIDEADLTMIARFRRGRWEIPKEIVTEVPQDVVTMKQSKRTPKEQKATLPTGFVTITELCKGTPVPATMARALLRASHYTKPSYGWAFGPKDLPDVKKLIGLV